MHKRNILILSLIIIVIIVVVILLISNNSDTTLIFPENTPSEKTLFHSAVMAGGYLINATEENGKFVYEYDPVNNITSES